MLLESLPDPQCVLDKPFVYSLGRGSHEDPSFEIRFREDVGQCGGVINVEATSDQFGCKCCGSGTLTGL
jgi:hypothetical protein